MKVCIIQPEYSVDYSQSRAFFEKEMEFLDACDPSMDMIVLPENCDIPCLAKTKEQSEASVAQFNQALLDKASQTAKRCNALVFLNVRSQGEKGLRNTTYAFDRNGQLAGQYYKQHLVPSEVSVMQLDSDYSFEFSEPTVIELEGIRFGFLVCYDFYFYEAFPNLARQNLDVIIGCSHQRSDTHQALSLITRFLAYHTNAYVVRASVSMGENAQTGGASMVVAPDGTVLCDLENRVGMATAQIDVTKKYYKPAGFGNAPSAHYQYIELGRRPWKYRPAGSAIVRPHKIMPYPRVCACDGLQTAAPAGSMAAFGAAVATGAQEIRITLWQTKDGQIVSLPVPELDKISNGTGLVSDYTYDQLLEMDFGVKHSDGFADLKVTTLEEILKQFSCHAVMNLCIGTCADSAAVSPEFLEKIAALLHRYDCEKYVYFTTDHLAVLQQLQSTIATYPRCWNGEKDPLKAAENATAYGCEMVQLSKNQINSQLLQELHNQGIRCAASGAEDLQEERNLLQMGVDILLSKTCHRTQQAI